MKNLLFIFLLVMPCLSFAQKNLFDAVAKGDIEFIRRYQGDLNAKNNQGDTALIFAVKNRKTDAAAALISAKANVNAKDKFGWTALMWAAYVEPGSVIEALVAAKADANARLGNGTTALILSALNNNPEAI